jgi:hypothetical protein
MAAGSSGTNTSPLTLAGVTKHSLNSVSLLNLLSGDVDGVKAKANLNQYPAGAGTAPYLNFKQGAAKYTSVSRPQKLSGLTDVRNSLFGNVIQRNQL